MRFKYWLVLLLAVILPLKGAMAAAGMLCHVPTAAAALVAPMPHEHGLSSYGESHSHDAAAGHDVGSHHADAGDANGKASDSSCRACAAICGASPLPPAIADRVPTLEPVRDWYVLVVPKPPHLTLAGLERPPRTL